MAGDATSGVIMGGTGDSTILGGFTKYDATSRGVTLTALTKTGTGLGPGTHDFREQFGMVGNATSGVVFGGSTSKFVKYAVCLLYTSPSPRD